MNQEGDFGIPVPDYVEENVSTKVVKIIQSYTGVVNKMVWRKELWLLLREEDLRIRRSRCITEKASVLQRLPAERLPGKDSPKGV